MRCKTSALEIQNSCFQAVPYVARCSGRFPGYCEPWGFDCPLTRAFPPYNYPMDSLINALFSIILVTDVRSPNPAIAAMKRARLWMIVCVIGEVVFLGLAFAMRSDEAATVSPVHVVQDLVSWLYFGGAVCCFVAFAWNTWVWWRVRHIY